MALVALRVEAEAVARGVVKESENSGSTLPRDKAVSRRQTMQYGKARPTQQRRILAKEAVVFLVNPRVSG